MRQAGAMTYGYALTAPSSYQRDGTGTSGIRAATRSVHYACERLH
jgi:hypothetical protein